VRVQRLAAVAVAADGGRCAEHRVEDRLLGALDDGREERVERPAAEGGPIGRLVAVEPQPGAEREEGRDRADAGQTESDPALENVRFAQGAARRAGRDLPEPGDVLATVGLEADARRPLSELTPGHLQLAALAVAMAPRPGVLLADEPTSQLDHPARDLVLERMSAVNRVLGTTIVLVTHDPDVAAYLPRTITIRDGRVGGEGRSGEEYAVVTPDGFLPLPLHVREHLHPGTLVRFHRSEDEADGQYVLIAEEAGHEGGGGDE
jgi:hypothetical protein